jgi:hypothetical protein
VDGKLRPSLFFRDVGSHHPNHHVAVDSAGLCHLTLTDVDIGQFNRLKLLWLIGDLKKGKWTEAWLIDHRDRFTSTAHPWSAASGDTIHLIWSVTVGHAKDEDRTAGVFHVARTKGEFGKKLRLAKGEIDTVAMAVDKSGRVLVVFSTEEGVFVMSRPANGMWTRPAPLHASLKQSHNVSVEPHEKSGFIIRTGRDETREWLLSAE